MNISLGFSPCPNDTFIFDAMVHHKIDTEGIKFSVKLEDVETLNRHAFDESYDITKISFHAMAYAAENYQLLDAGSALGRNCGPILITKNKLEGSGREIEEKVNVMRIAIPGKYTTANFLLGLFFPRAAQKIEMRFDKIEDAILNDEADAGVIIHENRFTFEQKGLHKIIDLGERWENETGHHIPLGGIAVRRSLPGPLKQKINNIIRRSVEYAFANPESSAEYVKAHSQEIKPEVVAQHIALYVNKYSIDLGSEGKSAVRFLYEKASALKLIPEINGSCFLND